MTDELTKRITVEQMAAAVEKLQPDDTVEVNAVGNILVRNRQGESIGYIDFLDGEVQFWKDAGRTDPAA